jgi:ubiquinone/menaquinone biosynthesis C-methylase UbiE
MKSADTAGSAEVKQCCANLYESDFAKLLLGDSFHPGGLKLTGRLGQLLRLDRNSRVLDVASGRGTSAMFLAERFGCKVVGQDFGQQNVQRANSEAAECGLSALVQFEQGDSESLPFPDGAFDAVICECAFCTFPDKSRAASGFTRVLKPGGWVGISDLTRAAELPKELESLLAWIACIADAQPVEKYVDWLRTAGLTRDATEVHDEALIEMVRTIQGKLFAAEVMSGLKKIDLPGINPTTANQMAKAALDAIRDGQLGYALIRAQKL